MITKTNVTHKHHERHAKRVQLMRIHEIQAPIFNRSIFFQHHLILFLLYNFFFELTKKKNTTQRQIKHI